MPTDTPDLDENDRLALARLGAANHWLRDEVARLTLTDVEREAVRFCGELCRQGERDDLAATLRGLLERTK